MAILFPPTRSCTASTFLQSTCMYLVLMSRPCVYTIFFSGEFFFQYLLTTPFLPPLHSDMLNAEYSRNPKCSMMEIVLRMSYASEQRSCPLSLANEQQGGAGRRLPCEPKSGSIERVCFNLPEVLAVSLVWPENPARSAIKNIYTMLKIVSRLNMDTLSVLSTFNFFSFSWVCEMSLCDFCLFVYFL